MRDDFYSPMYKTYQERLKLFGSSQQKALNKKYPQVKNEFTEHLISWEEWYSNSDDSRKMRFEECRFFKNVVKQTINRYLYGEKAWLIDTGINSDKPDFQLCTYSGDGHIVSSQYFVCAVHLRNNDGKLFISKYDENGKPNRYFDYLKKYDGQVGYALADPFERTVYYMPAVGPGREWKYVQQFLSSPDFNSEGTAYLDKTLFKKFYAVLPSF